MRGDNACATTIHSATIHYIRTDKRLHASRTEHGRINFRQPALKGMYALVALVYHIDKRAQNVVFVAVILALQFKKPFEFLHVTPPSIQPP